MRFENSILINRPTSDVFAFVSNFENMPKWDHRIRSTTNESGRDGLGAMYLQEGQSGAIRFVVTEFEKNHRVTVESIPPARRFKIRMTIEPAEGGTKLVDERDFSSGFPRLLERLPARRIKARVAEDLRTLKELLETGRVTLQDGRIEQL